MRTRMPSTISPTFSISHRLRSCFRTSRRPPTPLHVSPTRARRGIRMMIRGRNRACYVSLLGFYDAPGTALVPGDGSWGGLGSSSRFPPRFDALFGQFEDRRAILRDHFPPGETAE